MNSRRNFFKLSLGGALAATLSRYTGSIAGGLGNGTPKKLVIALAYGGWDPSFTIDPKPDSPEVDYIPGSLRMFGNLPIWVDPSRGNVTSFFEQWASRSAVINGVAIQSLAHETCVDVMLTGFANRDVPDLGARVARELGDDKALPYLALSPQAEVKGLEASAGQLGDTNQIMALANNDLAWPSPGQAFPNQGLQLSARERELMSQYLAGSTESMRNIHGESARSTKRIDDYAVARSRMNTLQASARAGGFMGDAALFQDVSSSWKHVASALAEDLSQVAIVQPNILWDTHQYNFLQSDAYEEFYGGLNLLMSELQRHSIVDDTVVVVLSEMGRTPRHNASGGKDHWPWTSAMIVGGNVSGGRAYGETNEWMQPKPINLNTGESDEAGEELHAGHVLRTVSKLVGIEDANWFEREAIDGLIA